MKNYELRMKNYPLSIVNYQLSAGALDDERSEYECTGQYRQLGPPARGGYLGLVESKQHGPPVAARVFDLSR
jgi:hypothetical protein